MARAIQQIKQDLAALEAIVATLAIELRNIYLKYLNLLSQSVRKQLILASYQLCTQAYPEAFLQLSFSQRQKLQENLRQLGQQIQAQLLSYLENPKQPAASASLNIMEQMLTNSPQDSQKSEAESSSVNPSNQDTTERITHPEDLVQWCKRIEQGMNEALEQLSQKANRYLQEAKVLPPQLPTKILEMALRDEETASPISSSPNLLNLLIEADENESEQDSKVTKITAIHLRLPEIEFADPTLSVEHKQIRNLLDKLNKIRQQYQQKQREYAIAEAEAAWRASWYED